MEIEPSVRIVLPLQQPQPLLPPPLEPIHLPRRLVPMRIINVRPQPLRLIARSQQQLPQLRPRRNSPRVQRAVKVQHERRHEQIVLAVRERGAGVRHRLDSRERVAFEEEEGRVEGGGAGELVELGEEGCPRGGVVGLEADGEAARAVEAVQAGGVFGALTYVRLESSG